METADLLNEREQTHGNFRDNARCCVALQETVEQNWKGPKPTDIQKTALDYILMKIARIVTGDATHKDSWDDIAGYATLAAKELTDTYDSA